MDVKCVYDRVGQQQEPKSDPWKTNASEIESAASVRVPVWPSHIYWVPACSIWVYCSSDLSSFVTAGKNNVSSSSFPSFSFPLLDWIPARLWSLRYNARFDGKPSPLGNTSCVTTAWRHQVGQQRARLQGTGAAGGSRRERGCYVFIKSTRKQLRRLCSLDTPHLFIIIPLAVTLLFIIACWFICSSSLKPHLTSSFTLTEPDVVGMYKDVAL